MSPPTTHRRPTTSARHPRRVLLRTGGALSALVLTLAACGGEDGAAAATPEELCDLVSAAEVGDLVGADDARAEAGTNSAPNSCVYSYTRPEGLEGTANIFVTMLSGDRTGGKTGSDALAHVREETGGGDGELAGVDAEHFTSSGGPGQMVAAVDGEGRVVTLMLDSDLSDEQQAAVTNTVLDALAE